MTYTMKTVRLSPFRLTLMGALAMASAALADTVTLSGTVGTTATVVSTGTTGAESATNLPLGGTGADIGEQIIKVADVTLTTNNSSGLTVTITSGVLSNGTTPSANIPFQVTTVADSAPAPQSADFTVASGANDTYSTAGDADPTNVERDLYIAYTPAAKQDPGTYSGTITLTVADN